MLSDKERPKLPHWDLTERILRCFYESYGELGHGFSEAVLCRGLVIALREAGLEVWQETPLDVYFRGRRIGSFFADIVVNRTVLVEVKGSAHLEQYGTAQLLNYLKAAGGGVGLLLNFGRRPEHKRLVVGDPTNSLPTLNGRAVEEKEC
jgi:GxxExxY protein